MNKKTWLGGLLAAQLVLSAGVFLHNQRDKGANVAEPLLDFAVAEVDRIVIDDNAQTATLSRDGAHWQLDGLAELPANAGKIETLLTSLEELRTTWPVVSSASGRERFEVTANKFQRRLQLYQGDTLLGEYFFGTSPGFRRTHGRRAEDDAVYTLAFNNVDLPGDSNDWLDKALLAAGTPQKIKGPDFEISKGADTWQLHDPSSAASPAPLNDAEVNELVSALASLRVLRAEEAMPEGARVDFVVTTPDGEWHYEFTSANSKYYVKRSDHESAFTISQTDYERIAGKNRALIIATPEPAAADGAQTDEHV